VLVVDSSVWIDFFNDAEHPAVELLSLMLDRGEMRIVVPDLVLYEVLRGFREEADYRAAKRLMEGLHVQDTASAALALAAAGHYRNLRSQGITVRSSIDVLVATFCIEHDYALLHRDRDYEAFEQRRGLRTWSH
jgi:predicted nucleic acid-binding protein